MIAMRLFILLLVIFIGSSSAQTRQNVTCIDSRYSCQNDGMCIARATATNNYVCSCKSPYCGKTCTRRIPDCIEEEFNCEKQDMICLNDGVCISSPLFGGYLCSCRTGFCGNRCNNRQPNCMIFA